MFTWVSYSLYLLSQDIYFCRVTAISTRQGNCDEEWVLFWLKLCETNFESFCFFFFLDINMLLRKEPVQGLTFCLSSRMLVPGCMEAVMPQKSTVRIKVLNAEVLQLDNAYSSLHLKLVLLQNHKIMQLGKDLWGHRVQLSQTCTTIIHMYACNSNWMLKICDWRI